MNSLQKDNINGFTLVEVLVSILIFSIVITMLFSSFRSFMVSGVHIKESLVQSQNIRSLFKRIAMDLEAIHLSQPPRYKKPEFGSDPDPYRFEGTQESVEGQMASSMRFISLSHARLYPGDREGMAKIVYYLRANTTQGFDLCRSDILMPIAEEVRSCTDPVLYKDIKSFNLVYFDRNGERYEYWDSESETFKYSFPARIGLTVRLGSDENEQVFQTAITLIPTRRAFD